MLWPPPLPLCSLARRRACVCGVPLAGQGDDPAHVMSFLRQARDTGLVSKAVFQKVQRLRGRPGLATVARPCACRAQSQ